ncbi:phosphoribosyltransferase [Rubrolithibacter danxiaensis]|uniref:phosphoribosyltransferase n=1 Tax=Rubrolithibacter danxiaensis TaxID=3390805 RepID=UPI003BF85801
MYSNFGVMYSVKNDRFFKNRQDAGKELALLLEPKYKDLNPIVLGIPRGGVEVAYYVAQQLAAELCLVVAKKLPFPGHEEYGFGAIAEDYSVYVSQHGKEALEPKVINQIIEEQIEEVNRRVEKYRNGKPLPDMKGRTVILVDDGIAIGVTLVPVIKLCKKKEAGKIILATPVSGTRFDPHLNEADAIEVIVQPLDFYAVGQVYETFGDFSDEQLLKLLKKAEEWQK